MITAELCKDNPLKRDFDESFWADLDRRNLSDAVVDPGLAEEVFAGLPGDEAEWF